MAMAAQIVNVLNTTEHQNGYVLSFAMYVLS